MSLNTSYQPKEYETSIQEIWQKAGVGKPEKHYQKGQNDGKTTHTILMPPPNLTGPMHAGHSYQHYLMDTLSRYNRQRGKWNLWYPGVDHAGIQLEGVISKLILKGEFDSIIQEKLTGLDFICKEHDKVASIIEFDGETILREDLHTWLKKNHPDLWLELAWSKVNLWRDNQKQQAQVLGDTPDYSRQLFTLDPKAVEMVNLAYIKYWEDNLIYKGAYLVNWSVGLQTALSDVAGEIEYETKVDPFISFYYDLEEINFPGDTVPESTAQILAQTIQETLSTIEVSTVRPETIFGDVAIAVHPKILEKLISEKKFSQQIIDLIESSKLDIYYKIATLNKFKVKLIISGEVDPDFGSGALKITPASDITDYNIWKKYLQNDIPVFPHSIDRSGRLSLSCGDYSGLSVQTARIKIIKDLIENGQVPFTIEPDLENGESELKEFEVLTDQELEKLDYKKQIEYLAQLYPEYKVDWNYSHNVSICERTKTVIEPLISEEFFLSFENKAISTGKNLQQHGLEGVGEVNFYTPDFKDRATNFLENIHDWCISRDVIWGHKMPVWYNLDLNSGKLFFDFNQMESEVEIEGQNHLVANLFKVQVDKPTQPGNWVREEKILDTWFSSSLWPLSTLNYPATQLPVHIDVQEVTTENIQPDSKDCVFVIIHNPQTDQFLIQVNPQDSIHSTKYHLLGRKLKAGENQVAGIFRELEEEAGITSIDPEKLKFVGNYKIIRTQNKNNKELNIELNSQIFYLPNQDYFDSWLDSGNGKQTTKWVERSDLIANLIPAFTDLIESLDGIEKHDLPEIFYTYPTQELTTAKEIFYVWVVRMIVLSKYFTGQIPFESVVITPTVLDETGKKMSKSLGNGLDPVEAISNYSSDSLRLAMMAGMYPNRNMRLGGDIANRAMEKYRNFGNKIWNVARFIELMEEQNPADSEVESKELSDASKWILDKFISLEDSFEKEVLSYELGHIVDDLYNFLWDYFANWYVEYLKTEPSQISFARKLFTQFIKLSHPFLPYETEVLWKEFVGGNDLLVFERYDVNWSRSLQTPSSNNDFENIVSLLQNIRSTRGLFAIDPAGKIKATTTSKKILEYQQFFHLIGKVEIKLSDNSNSAGYLIKIEGHDISLDLLDYIQDPALEIIKTNKQVDNINKQISIIDKTLANPQFIQKAEKEVIEQKNSDLESRKADLGNLNLKLQFLKSNSKV